jgi:2-methylcitrate dehydratase PrpD
VLNALRYQHPENELEAKFSLPFALAILVLERKAGIRQFSDESVRRPDVQAMMRRVVPYLHPEVEAQGYQRIRSLLEVRLKDGRVLAREASTSRGTPERPMSREELAEKFRECAQGILTEERMEKVLKTVYELETLQDVRSLGRLLGA